MRAAVLCAAVLALAPAPAVAQEAPYDDWNADYAGFPSGVARDPVADCADRSDACIDRTITEMYRRFHTVVPVCDHNAVFSLTYTRVTEDIRRGLHENFYPDRAWLNHLDAIFARLYFIAYDNWAAGRRELVPESWRLAFDAARDRRVIGLGNLLMSMNAHVNRDFPFVLHHAGLVSGDGRSLKPDHDSGNARLRALYKPMLTELAQRFDATTDDYDAPGTELDDEAIFSILVMWREWAWRAAEMLAGARDDAERRQVAALIESFAVGQAHFIEANSALLAGGSSEARDALCAKAGGQDPSWSAPVARSQAPTASSARPRAGRVRPTRRGRVPVTLTCPAAGVGCSGTVRLLHGRRAVGRRSFSLPPGATRRIGVRVPASVRRARRARLTVVVSSGGREHRARLTLRR